MPARLTLSKPRRRHQVRYLMAASISVILLMITLYLGAQHSFAEGIALTGSKA